MVHVRIKTYNYIMKDEGNERKKVAHVYAVKKEKLIYTYKSETTTKKHPSLPSFLYS